MFNQVASPLSGGLFVGAISQSGYPTAVTVARSVACLTSCAAQVSAEYGLDRTTRWAARLGCNRHPRSYLHLSDPSQPSLSDVSLCHCCSTVGMEACLSRCSVSELITQAQVGTCPHGHVPGMAAQLLPVDATASPSCLLRHPLPLLALAHCGCQSKRK